MKKAYLYAGISILLWSTIATVSKLLLSTLNSYQVLMLSSLFAAAALLVTTVINGKIKLLSRYRIKDYLITLLIGLPGTFLYYVFLYSGTAKMAVTWALALKLGGTAKISNLAYATPFISLVWTFFILEEPIKPLSLIGLAVIIVGIFIQMKDKGKNEP